MTPSFLVNKEMQISEQSIKPPQQSKQHNVVQNMNNTQSNKTPNEYQSSKNKNEFNNEDKKPNNNEKLSQVSIENNRLTNKSTIDLKMQTENSNKIKNSSIEERKIDQLAKISPQKLIIQSKTEP